MFFSSISGINAEFQPLDLETKGGYLQVSTELDPCFTEEFDRIILTGYPVRFEFTASVYEKGSNRAVYETKFYHEIRHHLLDRTFTVYLSESDLTIETETLEKAKDLMRIVNKVPTAPSEIFETGKIYYLKINAGLNKIYMENIKKEVNLIFYWNGIRPEKASSEFTRSLMTK